MAKRASGLGRGFGSLIPTENVPVDIMEDMFDPTRDEDLQISKLLELDIDLIVRDEEQPRKEFGEAGLMELANSIKQHGVLQPIVVTKVQTPEGERYQIVAGERRWRASKLAELKKIPAIVRTLSDQNRLEMAIIENAQREDLNPIELATAYAKLKAQFNLTPDQIGERVGKKGATVINTMRLLKLPEEAKRAMQEHNLMEGPMRPLIGKDPELIHEVLPKMIEGEWPARKVEQYIAEHKKKSSSVAVKTGEFLAEEKRLEEKWGVVVRIRGRSVTLSAKNDKGLRELLDKL